LLETLRYGPW